MPRRPGQPAATAAGFLIVTTWIPDALDPAEIAARLNQKHLNAQRGNEGLVVVRALAARERGERRGYQNHPATVMWRGHLRALCEYQIEMCIEWRRRGYEDGCQPEYEAVWREQPRPTRLPPWWGVTPLHRQHTESLVYRFPDHYMRQFPGVPPIAVDGSDVFLWPPDPTAPNYAERFAAQVAEYQRRLDARGEDPDAH